MKKYIGYFFYLSFVLLLVTGLQSCDNKIIFEKSKVVPAAQGWVKITKDKNGNYKIELHVERLAEPPRLTPPQEVYIVWVTTPENELKKVGLLKTEDGAFSEKLRSTLYTVTPDEPTRIFITAESSPNVNSPGNIVVLSTPTIENN